MSPELQSILALTCAVPAIAGLRILGKIQKEYKALVFIFVLAFVVELIGVLEDKNLFPDSVIQVNLFIVINTLLHIYFFKKIKVLTNKKIEYLITGSFLFLIFILCFLKNIMHQFWALGAIVSNIIILGLSMEGIIQYTIINKTKWLKETISVFCLINILYTANFIFIFSFRLTSLQQDHELVNSVEDIHKYLNAACNILFSWPIICIPRTNNYTR